MLCQYKDIFGEPAKGVHAYRVLDIAIVDMGMTTLAAYLLSQRMGISFPHTWVSMIALGVVAHRVFCVNTTLNKVLFGVVE